MNRLESLMHDNELMLEIQARIKNDNGFQKPIPFDIPQQDFKNILEGTFTDFSSESTEAVILDFLRPCLLIKNNSFNVPESDVWKSRLEPYRKVIERRIPSVGRVEFKFHPRFKWGGTGWLITENLIITNRHVAEIFALQTADGIVISSNSLGTTIEVSIDFNEEYQTDKTSIEATVEQVIYMADRGYPDVAILKLSSGARTLEPIPISTGNLIANSELAVIGYPAYDPYRNPLKPTDITRIFGDIFEYKRLSPGLLLNEAVHDGVFSHDASTLGGNSGSVVLDIKTGQAVGLHFSGVFHQENYAVSAKAILEVLSKTSLIVHKVAVPTQIPPSSASADEKSIREEGPAASYSNRKGYESDFLENFTVPLPLILDDKQLVKFAHNEFILKYHHFSVAMNKDRRMCYYSAVNINGAKAYKTRRPGWRLDPRIGEEFQIIAECYGNQPKFSRGHMTRREDPAWGADHQQAALGNADSMHVTNTVPQIQPFNAGIWLGLEDYALQNAKSDKMKISVFTGPFFTDKDPVRDGIKVPIDFWKVIAFIHEETGKLCATGYTMSQEDFLKSEEFIFGQHHTYQVSINSIEQRSGLSFGTLSSADPYVGTEVLLTPLSDFTQIKFS